MDYILLGKSPNAQMNFGKIFERKRADAAPRNAEEISKIKERIEKEDRAFEDELPAKYSLLQEFSEDELKKLCDQVLGARPPKEEFADKGGTPRDLPQFKEDYIHFIIDELRLAEIRSFAVKNKIVPGGHFRD